MNATVQRARGFLLVEVVLGVLLSGIVFAALAAGLVALIRGLQPARVTLNGEALPIAPGFAAFPDAVRLHQTFVDHLVGARAVYVFGGRHLSIPAEAPAAAVRPLALPALPAMTDFPAGLPMDAKTFYDRYRTSLGEPAAAPSPEDFSVLVIGTADARLAPTCLVQVRRTDASVADGGSVTPYVVREVRLWDRDGAQRYAFAERPLQSAGDFVGAVHTWLRYRLDGDMEEGPACVAFPDPWLYAGIRGTGTDVPPFSRFAYLLPVSR